MKDLYDCLNCGESERVLERHQNGDDSRVWYVECRQCTARTNDFLSADDAMESWNEDFGSAWEEEEEEEEEEDPHTIAALVRMLDETRTQHEALKEEYIEQAGVNNNLRNILKEEQTNNQPIRDLEQTITNLEGVARIKESQTKRREEEYAVQSTELQKSLECSRESREKVRDHKKVLAYIDVELLKFQAHLFDDMKKGNFHQEEDLKRIDTFLHSLRQDTWDRPDKSTLNEVIQDCGPYGSHTNMHVYHKAVGCLSNPKETDALFGMVMSTYSQGGRLYTLAWEALGKPGETKHSGRRPRT